LPNKIEKKLAFFTQNYEIMLKLDHNIGFKEKRQFFRRKSLKLVVITLTPLVLKNRPSELLTMSKAVSISRVAVAPMSARLLDWAPLPWNLTPTSLEIRLGSSLASESLEELWPPRCFFHRFFFFLSA
jgi:hypothetical protein